MWKIGDTAEASKTLTETDITLFTAITGDFNPIHVNAEYAKKTQFGQRVVHGCISSGLISALIGMKLPGIGAIYLSQEVVFKKPVFIGDTITVKGEITDVQQTSKFPIYTIQTDCYNQNGICVTEGKAKVGMIGECV